MTVPGQSGDKKHRFLSVSETCFHKGKCPFQLSADLFRTGFSLLRHFRKQLPDPFKTSLCICDMFLSDSKAEFLQSTDHKLFRGLLFQVKKLRLQTDSQTFLLHICKFIQRRHVLFILKKSFQMQKFLINSTCLTIHLLIGQKTSVQTVKQNPCHKESFLKGSFLRHFYFFLLFFLLTNFLKNPAQGVALQSPSVGEILSTVVFAGVTEELFFRGLLLNSLLSKLSFGKADVISAAAFLLIHFPSWLSAGAASPAQLLSNAASVFLVGLLLGGVFEKTRNLWGPIFFHSLYNLGVIFLVI